MSKGRLWLCVAPVALCVLDAALTLRGQPDAYAAGDFGQAVEGNPPARWFLQQGPGPFVAFVAVWVGLFSGALALLPRGPAHALALALACGHALGAASWLAADGAVGLCLAVLLLSLARGLLGWTWLREAARAGVPGVKPRARP